MFYCHRANETSLENVIELSEICYRGMVSQHKDLDSRVCTVPVVMNVFSLFFYRKVVDVGVFMCSDIQHISDHTEIAFQGATKLTISICTLDIQTV